MNRWKFALLSGRGQAKINGLVYKIDEEIYRKQKNAIFILSVIFIAVIIGLIIIQLATNHDTMLDGIIAFCIYTIADYLLGVILIPKDIKNHVTLQENDTAFEVNS